MAWREVMVGGVKVKRVQSQSGAEKSLFFVLMRTCFSVLVELIKLQHPRWNFCKLAVSGSLFFFCFHLPLSAFVATEAGLIVYLLTVCQTCELFKTDELEFKAKIPAVLSFFNSAWGRIKIWRCYIRGHIHSFTIMQFKMNPPSSDQKVWSP